MLKDKDFLKKFFKVSFPVMLHALILFIVNFLDNIMVSSVSNEAVSAVYAVNQVTYILMIASYGVIIGAGVFIQQFNGAKDKKNLKEAFCYKILIMLVFLIIFITIYYLFGHHLVYFYCQSDTNKDLIYELGKDYLYVMILSYIPFCLSIIYTTTVREIGETKYALIAGVVAFVSNIILNYIFIYLFNMGVVGAALGTVIARIIELVLIVIMCHYKKFDFCHDLFNPFKVSKKLAIEITKKGLVFLANELFWVIGMTLLSLAYAQRENVLSALSVVSSIGNIFNIIFQGLSIGIGVMVGSYLGEGKFDLAKDYAKKVYWLGFLISVIFGILIVILSPVIPMMFKEVDESQKAIATEMLFAYGFLIWGSCMYCCCYVTLKTGGEAVTTFLIDSGLMWMIAVPLAWILVKFTNLSLVYVYSIIVGFDILKFLASYYFVKKDKWLNNLTVNA
jgi:putative MATE family efflux protein